MKKLVLVCLSLGLSSLALAVPRSNYLASPKKIEVKGDKVELTFDLACSNEYPDEWAGNLVGVSDDEGDMAIALGVVLSKDSCTAGPVKEFTFTYPLSKINVTQKDLAYGTTFQPIDLAK